MRRRALSVEAIAVRRIRWAVESESIAGEARQLDGALVSSLRHVRFGAATQPHRRLPTPRRWAEHYRRNACDTATNSGADTQASKARQAGTSRRARIAAAKLRELAAEAREGRDAATLERLIVKGLTRYHHGLDNEERTALAATGLPLTGTSGTR